MAFMGHPKNNEANVLQECVNSPECCLCSLLLRMGMNTLPECNIFELPHYFWNDPYHAYDDCENKNPGNTTTV